MELTDTPLTWLCTGDSITQGLVHTFEERTWFEVFHEQVRGTAGRRLDAVVNTGVSGWTTGMVLAEYDRLVGRFGAEVVSISLGMNDAARVERATPHDPDTFTANLVELVRRSRADGAHTVILQTPNTISPSAVALRPDLATYVERVCRVAAETGSILVDHHAFWLETFGEADPVRWLNDPIHPNGAGHRAMANLMLRTLGLPEFDHTWV